MISETVKQDLEQGKSIVNDVTIEDLGDILDEPLEEDCAARIFSPPVKFFDDPANVRLLKQCIPVSISIVDYKKFPSYYRKAIPEANNENEETIKKISNEETVETKAVEFKNKKDSGITMTPSDTCQKIEVVRPQEKPYNYYAKNNSSYGKFKSVPYNKTRMPNYFKQYRQNKSILHYDSAYRHCQPNMYNRVNYNEMFVCDNRWNTYNPYYHSYSPNQNQVFQYPTLNKIINNNPNFSKPNFPPYDYRAIIGPRKSSPIPPILSNNVKHSKNMTLNVNSTRLGINQMTKIESDPVRQNNLKANPSETPEVRTTSGPLKNIPKTELETSKQQKLCYNSNECSASSQHKIIDNSEANISKIIDLKEDNIPTKSSEDQTICDIGRDEEGMRLVEHTQIIIAVEIQKINDLTSEKETQSSLNTQYSLSSNTESHVSFKEKCTPGNINANQTISYGNKSKEDTELIKKTDQSLTQTEGDRHILSTSYLDTNSKTAIANFKEESTPPKTNENQANCDSSKEKEDKMPVQNTSSNTKIHQSISRINNEKENKDVFHKMCSKKIIDTNIKDGIIPAIINDNETNCYKDGNKEASKLTKHIDRINHIERKNQCMDQVNRKKEYDYSPNVLCKSSIDLKENFTSVKLNVSPISYNDNKHKGDVKSAKRSHTKNTIETKKKAKSINQNKCDNNINNEDKIRSKKRKISTQGESHDQCVNQSNIEKDRGDITKQTHRDTSGKKPNNPNLKENCDPIKAIPSPTNCEKYKNLKVVKPAKRIDRNNTIEVQKIGKCVNKNDSDVNRSKAEITIAKQIKTKNTIEGKKRNKIMSDKNSEIEKKKEGRKSGKGIHKKNAEEVKKDDKCVSLTNASVSKCKEERPAKVIHRRSTIKVKNIDECVNQSNTSKNKSKEESNPAKDIHTKNTIKVKNISECISQCNINVRKKAEDLKPAKLIHRRNTFEVKKMDECFSQTNGDVIKSKEDVKPAKLMHRRNTIEVKKMDECFSQTDGGVIKSNENVKPAKLIHRRNTIEVKKMDECVSQTDGVIKTKEDIKSVKLIHRRNTIEVKKMDECMIQNISDVSSKADLKPIKGVHRKSTIEIKTDYRCTNQNNTDIIKHKEDTEAAKLNKIFNTSDLQKIEQAIAAWSVLQIKEIEKLDNAYKKSSPSNKKTTDETVEADCTSPKSTDKQMKCDVHKNKDHPAKPSTKTMNEKNIKDHSANGIKNDVNNNEGSRNMDQILSPNSNVLKKDCELKKLLETPLRVIKKPNPNLKAIAITNSGYSPPILPIPTFEEMFDIFENELIWEYARIKNCQNVEQKESNFGKRKLERNADTVAKKITLESYYSKYNIKEKLT